MTAAWPGSGVIHAPLAQSVTSDFQAKEGHSLVCVCALCVHALEGGAQRAYMNQ